MNASRKTSASLTKKKTSARLSSHTHLQSKKSAQSKSTSLFSTVKRYSKCALRSTLLSPFFQKTTHYALIGLLVGSSLYGVYHLVGRTFANEVVISKSEIVSRVAKLTNVPEYEPYDVVRVEDGTDLKKQNEFYKDVKEGDYILMYSSMAIIYDLRDNRIIGIRTKENVKESVTETSSTPADVQKSLVDGVPDSF